MLLGNKLQTVSIRDGKFLMQVGRPADVGLVFKI